MRFVLLVACLVALFAAPAEAFNRCTKVPGTAGIELAADALERPERGIETVSTACHDTALNTATDSGILAVWRCANFDLDGSAMAGGTAYIYRCTAPSTSLSYCTKMLVDTDGDGIPDDVPLDGATIGKVGQQYQTALWLWIDWQAAPTGYGRIAGLCH